MTIFLSDDSDNDGSDNDNNDNNDDRAQLLTHHYIPDREPAPFSIWDTSEPRSESQTSVGQTATQASTANASDKQCVDVNTDPVF